MLSPATGAEQRAIVDRLADALPGTGTVCVFRPMPGEVDPTGLMELHPHSEYVTTRTGDNLRLTVHPVDAEMELHHFGYEQPVAGSPEVDPVAVDVFCVPGLAFDESGGRLGHGAGYYDRLLARARPDAIIAAVTLERRIFPRIPTDEFDVPMDVVVTEERIIRPRTGVDEA